MHAVFHPANAFVTAAIIQTPLILMGVSPKATLAASVLIDLQSLVSHFIVDLRAGFLNYIFIGTETHRYHHSASVKDAGNYGNTLAIWDHLFGTFVYRPGIAPVRLGVGNPDEYPESNELARVLALPLARTPLNDRERPYV
jgi:sterol desaturase/sphingolipid hydroxylase (fatty acid hydroxylase superfamily)